MLVFAHGSPLYACSEYIALLQVDEAAPSQHVQAEAETIPAAPSLFRSSNPQPLTGATRTTRTSSGPRRRRSRRCARGSSWWPRPSSSPTRPAFPSSSPVRYVARHVFGQILAIDGAPPLPAACFGCSWFGSSSRRLEQHGTVLMKTAAAVQRTPHVHTHTRFSLSPV